MVDSCKQQQAVYESVLMDTEGMRGDSSFLSHCCSGVSVHFYGRVGQSVGEDVYGAMDDAGSKLALKYCTVCGFIVLGIVFIYADRV